MRTLHPIALVFGLAAVVSLGAGAAPQSAPPAQPVGSTVNSAPPISVPKPAFTQASPDGGMDSTLVAGAPASGGTSGSGTGLPGGGSGCIGTGCSDLEPLRTIVSGTFYIGPDCSTTFTGGYSGNQTCSSGSGPEPILNEHVTFTVSNGDSGSLACVEVPRASGGADPAVMCSDAAVTMTFPDGTTVSAEFYGMAAHPTAGGSVTMVVN